MITKTLIHTPSSRTRKEKKKSKGLGLNGSHCESTKWFLDDSMSKWIAS